jgi:glycine/D-amino acid oxidase-like deaminating enzyme
VTEKPEEFDAVIIGAGFFGAVLAEYLAKIPTINTIAVIEKESTSLARASANNQARIHQGFHYPRSIKTASSSRRTYDLFKSKWPRSVFSEFEHIYAISKFGSKVSPQQFEATMNAVKAPFYPADLAVSGSLFDMTRIEKAYHVKEEAFNYLELRAYAVEVFLNQKIRTFFDTKVLSIRDQGQKSKVFLDSGSKIGARYVFNVSYSGIDSIDGLSEETGSQVFHQLTEMPIVETPSELRDFGITVMDGPFFSLMPYPSIIKASTFSHVRYTQRRSNIGTAESNHLDDELAQLKSKGESAFELMKRDAARLSPPMAKLKLVGQIFETKTLLKSSLREDSRPILFIKHKKPGAYSILGGKVDNVFDMIERLNEERIE